MKMVQVRKQECFEKKEREDFENYRRRREKENILEQVKAREERSNQEITSFMT